MNGIGDLWVSQILVISHITTGRPQGQDNRNDLAIIEALAPAAQASTA